MYKVFINAHLIRLMSEELPLEDDGSHLCIIDPSQNELEILVETLFMSQNQLDIELVSNDLEGLWSTFQSTFSIIEAAGGVVRNQSGDKLLIKRLGKWDLPKGKMEKGERPDESALREIKEECGLSSLEIINELAPSYHVYRLGKLSILKKTYWFKIEAKGDIAVNPQTEEGITEVAWFSDKDLSKARENTYRSLEDLI